MNSSTRKSPQPLANSIFGILRTFGIETKVREFQAMSIWPEIVGARIADVAIPQRVDEGIMIVKVKSSAWRTELIYMKLDILDRIEYKIGKEIIKDIRYI